MNYAGFWIRFAASLIDVVLLLALVVPLVWMIYGEQALTQEEGNWFFDFILPAVVTILFWVYKSATPGKMILKLKIVDANSGEKPSVGKFILRYVAYIPAMLPLGLGIFWVAFDQRKQGWHDKIAGTLVVRQS